MNTKDDIAMLKYKPNWEETKERFDAWWKRTKIGRPMLAITAIRDTPLADPVEIPECNDYEKLHMDPERAVAALRNNLNTHMYLAESFPNTNVNIGPGSLAVYIGSEPIFRPDTVWYEHVVKNWREWGGISFDPENYWLKKHLEVIARQHELANGEFLVGIPDIIENVDILSSLRGPQELCYDLIDEPELITDYLGQLDTVYMKVYDAFYNVIKGGDGSSSYTCFRIWGKGKTAKLQCDFSALMSPDQFRQFVVPSLRKQCQQLDNTLYHLDGPDAIKHLDALMEIEELDALQWTPGAGNAGAADEKWYSIHDKVKAAGKSLWVSVSGDNYSVWKENADKLVKRYGSDGLYLLFPEMTESQAEDLLQKAERDWN